MTANNFEDVDERINKYWSTVIVRPTFWWRLRYFFKPHDLIFCWGEDRWMTSGFTGQEFLSLGGVPTAMRHRIRHRKPEEPT